MKHLHRIHRVASHRRTIAYSAILTALAMFFLFSPIMRTLPFRSLLAALTQNLILADVNPHRSSIGVTPLRTSSLLNEAARMKAEDMFARQYFSHYGPGNEIPWTWFDRLGYRYAAAGENLAIDFSDPDALVQAWLASPTHRKNIENGVFTDVGLGIADGVFGGRQTTIVVMFLGRELAPVVATTAAQPPPAESVPTPTPAPPPAPEPTPAPVSPPPPPQPIPSPEEISPPPTEQDAPPVIAQEGRPPSISEPLLVDDTPADEPLVVRTGELMADTTPSPWATRALLFFVVQAASSLRVVLSLIFGLSLAVHAVLYLHAAHRERVRRLVPSGIMLSFLVLLWLPELIA